VHEEGEVEEEDVWEDVVGDVREDVRMANEESLMQWREPLL
jgi:hypothetical protein